MVSSPNSSLGSKVSWWFLMILARKILLVDE